MKIVSPPGQDVKPKPNSNRDDPHFDLAWFFQAVFHRVKTDRAHLYLELAWLPPEGKPKDNKLPAEAIPLTELGRAARRAIELNREYNVYSGLNPRSPTWVARKGEDLTHAAAEDVAVIVGFCVDDPQNQLAALEEVRLPPSFIIETSPGKFQAIWLLREPIYRGSPDWDRAVRLQAELKRRLRAEAGDIVRVLRCPYTLNRKYNPMPKVTIISGFDGNPEHVFRYLPEELARWLLPSSASSSSSSPSSLPSSPPSTSTSTSQIKTAVSYKDLPLGGKRCLQRAFMDGVDKGMRNNTAIILASELRKLNRGRDEALKILKRWNARNRPPLADRELEGVITSAYKGEVYDYGCNEYRNLLGIDENACEQCGWLRKAREQAKAVAKATTKAKGKGKAVKQRFEARITRTFDYIDEDEIGAFVAVARGRKAHYIDQRGQERGGIRYGDLMIAPPYGVEVHKGLILYPTDVADYTSIEALFADLLGFFKQYYEAAREEDYRMMALYAVTTWFTPRLPAVPIFAIEGPSSKGKTRGAEILHLVCSYPYRSSGTKFASWVRTVDRYLPCTLLINEGDFDRRNPETEELVKFYNVRPVRDEAVFQRMADNKSVLSFNVFGPTIVTLRQPFSDDAVERRTFKIRPKSLTDERIPFNLGPEAHKQAQLLRNKLAQLALEHLPRYEHRYLTLADIRDYYIEPRLAQLCEGLINVAELIGLRKEVLETLQEATRMQKESIALTRDALIFRGFFHILKENPDIIKTGVTPGDIAGAVKELGGDISAVAIGKRALALGFVRVSRRHYTLPKELYRERAMDYLPLDELDEIEELLKQWGLW